MFDNQQNVIFIFQVVCAYTRISNLKAKVVKFRYLDIPSYICNL